MSLSTELTQKEIISKDEHLSNVELIKAGGEIAAGAVARFASLYESEIGKIFDDDGIDIYTALEEKAIILFILNPLLYPETSPLFGNLIIIDSKKAVSNLFNDRFKRVFFIFDEINVYASNALLDLVNKSGSANVTNILATQSLSDLDAKCGEYFKEQVIENCNNYLILRQNSAGNAEQWANIIGTHLSMDITYQVKEGGETGLGSMKSTREYLYHPDDIKNFAMGNAIFISKDNNFKSRLTVYKCF
jgi:type IV secretory pathway TraG/TraD family ATPase VirD4